MSDRQLALVLDKISALGVDGMALATRQVFIKGWLAVVAAVLVAAVTAVIAMALYRRAEKENDYIFSGDYTFWMYVALSVGGSSVVALCYYALTTLLNPRWAAIETIAGLFK